MVSYKQILFQLVENQRAHFKTGATRSVEARRKALLKLKEMVEKNSEEIGAAIQKDLGRVSSRHSFHHGTHLPMPRFRIQSKKSLTLYVTCRSLISHVEEWSAPKIVAKPQMFNNDSDEVMLMTEPLGVALVISPWNFPLVDVNASRAGYCWSAVFSRLSTLLKNTKGKIVYKPKEEPCRAECFLPPHVIEIEKDDALMQEEIFGPLLPIVTVKSFDEAIEWVRDNEKPLGAYLFTENPDKVKRFLLETSSGGVTVSTLPVGGVGNSGMGRLNGKYGFDNFVHEKPILVRKGLGKEVVARL
ncbi:aldehyde dehydrogenase family protein [Ostertagia ostertagi]